MVKTQTSYECSKCQYVASSYLGKCPECGSWGSFTEKSVTKKTAATVNKRQAITDQVMAKNIQPIRLNQVVSEQSERFSSGFPELDRVLGGGIMPGSYILIGGDPGIGKSTLMIQMADRVSAYFRKEQPNPQEGALLYVAGEESPFQIKQRAQRLGLKTEDVLVYPENNIHRIVETIQNQKPGLVIIDSIQAVFSPDLSGTPGSVGQIKECAGILMSVAKALQVTIFLVGHVTKEGMVSGPKLLEHTVDAVLYFEGEKYKNLRILRTVKNRFGGTHEIGVFEMAAGGLLEVTNPSELFLSESSYQNNPGSVIVSTLEGTRPMLVEIQALVGQSAYSTPRRVANGSDTNRLHQIVAVLERRLGLDFSRHDIYVNVVGGITIDEPAADLGVALAIVTSQRDLSVRPGTVVAGEIGPTGEVRPIRNTEARMMEAEKIGFQRMIIPTQTAKNTHQTSRQGESPTRPKKGKENPCKMEIVGVRSVMEAISAGLNPQPIHAQETTIHSTTTTGSRKSLQSDDAKSPVPVSY